MKEENGIPRKKWDFMIGIALVLFGSLRVYQRFQNQLELDYKIILTVIFIAYGAFLIYRHFQNRDVHK